MGKKTGKKVNLKKDVPSIYNKKDRYVMLRHLEISLMNETVSEYSIRYDFHSLVVPVFKPVLYNGKLNLNVFNPDDALAVSKIKYIRMVAPKDVLEKIDISKYCYEGEKVSAKKANINNDGLHNNIFDYVYITIPKEIFRVMMSEMRDYCYDTDKKLTKLSSLLLYPTLPNDIALLNKNKKVLCYAIGEVDNF